MQTAGSLQGFHDIFYRVTDHIAADLQLSDTSYHQSTNSKSIRRTLAQLARVHSSITRPAIVVLWRRLWDDRPLRHLLWVVGIARKTSCRCQWEIPPLEIRTRRELWPKRSWDRFEEYACLVREIVLDPFVGSGNMDTSVESKIWQDEFWSRLSSVVGDLPILPNLDVASLVTPNSFKYRRFDTGVLSLLNPSIRELNVILCRADTYDESKIRSALGECFSLLENVEVLSVEMNIPVLDLGLLTQTLPCLRYLRLDTGHQVNSDHLALLSCLRNLHFLSIDLSPQINVKERVAFTQLHTLRVLSDGFAALGGLVGQMDAPQLRTFSVSESHRDWRVMYEEVRSILGTLVLKCPFLTSVEWESKQVAGSSRVCLVDATLVELIKPLLSHSTLRHFSLDLVRPLIPYGPADFRAVAEAWPDLESFHLDEGSYYQGFGKPYADVESLVAFERRCPRLRSLHVPEVQFNLNSLEVAEETYRNSAPPHGLRELQVARSLNCSREEDANRCRERQARFRGWLEKVFPFAVIRIPSPM